MMHPTQAVGVPWTAALFNSFYPPGTRVRYYPSASDSERFVEGPLVSEAWELGHGDVIVKLEGISGGVSIRHLVILLPDNSPPESSKAA